MFQNERHFNGIAASDRHSEANSVKVVFVEGDIDSGHTGVLRAASTVQLAKSAILTWLHTTK